MLTDLQKALVANQKIQLTVWDAQDDTLEFHYHSCIQDADFPFFKVAPPIGPEAEQIAIRMQEGVIVGAIVEAHPAPFIFYPIVHSRQGNPASAFWLKVSENPNIEVMQRRRHVRIPMVIPVEVEFEAGTRWLSLPAFTEDLSGGGMRFTSPRRFSSGECLQLRFHVNDGQELLKLKGKVVLSVENRIRRRHDDLYATACSFYDIEDRQEMLIVRECFQRELKRPL